MSLGWRSWVALFAMLAFALQVQLTQTHIHNPNALSAIDQLASKLVAKSGKSSGGPIKNAPLDDSSCPICQAVGHSGQFVTPSAMALALPNFAVALVPLAIAVPAARDSVSHSWQGRAPPRH
jgi:hypothetical protein